MSKGNKKVKIRDIREGNWYWIHRVVLEKYAKKIGSIGLALYNTYASYARNKGRAFPSQKKICKTLNISRSTLIKYNKILVKEKLIKIKSGKEDGSSNIVYLLAVEGVKELNTACSTNKHPGVKEVNSKDKYRIKKINKEKRKGLPPNLKEKLNQLKKKWSISSYERTKAQQQAARERRGNK